MKTFHAKGFSISVALKVSPTIQHEWIARSIGGVIPALDGYGGEDTVMVDHATAVEIADDCEWYADPKAVDATPGERAAYRALARQARSAA